ncbi:hypothetical protein [Brevundimonas sp. LjRoot202]|uniref:hypothetical protein n=1 Tax=Brevundimonas sp. LjRoot202 TaxID=3342281 RepID=UPI003ECD72C8
MFELRTAPIVVATALMLASTTGAALAETGAGDSEPQSGQGPQDRKVFTAEQERHWRIIQETVVGIAYCNRPGFVDQTYAIPVLDWSGEYLDNEGRPVINEYARAVREAVARRRAQNGQVSLTECARFDGAEGARTRQAFMQAVYQLGIVAPEATQGDPPLDPPERDAEVR